MPTHISLRLRHPSQDLSRLAAKLQLPVSRIWTAGESRATPQGDPLVGAQRESYCAFRIVTAAGTIEAAIELLRQMLATSPSLKSELSIPGLSRSLYCTIEAEGEVLEVDSLKALVDMGVKLEISGC